MGRAGTVGNRGTPLTDPIGRTVEFTITAISQHLRALKAEKVRIAVVSLSLLLLPSLGITHAQRTQTPGARIDFSDPNGIIHQLATDDGPPADITINPADRAKVIRLLSEAKRNETGWHKQLAIYFLICLNQNYDENVHGLLRIWRSSSGDEGTMSLIILIYKHGHHELLEPILEAGLHSDGALSEELGDFYGEELESRTQEFVAALSGLALKNRDAACWLAGAADGGGMAPKTEARVIHNLMVLKSPVADRCARGVRTGNGDAEASSR